MAYAPDIDTPYPKPKPKPKPTANNGGGGNANNTLQFPAFLPGQLGALAAQLGSPHLLDERQGRGRGEARMTHLVSGCRRSQGLTTAHAEARPGGGGRRAARAAQVGDTYGHPDRIIQRPAQGAPGLP